MRKKFKNISKNKYLLQLFLIVIIAAVIRLPFLGKFPYGGESSYLFRLPTAVTSIISIGVFILLVKVLSGNDRLSLISGLSLTLLPWHIEQSRIYSPVMIELMFLLIAILLWNIASCKQCKLLITITSIIIFYRVYPTFWLFKLPFNLPHTSNYLSNVFKLISIEFIFFKNDSFWLGGFRTIGTLLPTTLPLFLAGIYTIIQKINKKIWIYFGIFLLILLISAANPLFPEQREYFLISPFLALILGFGVIKLIEQLKTSNILNNVIIIAYLIILSYDHLLFFHLYTIHYSNRIKNEISIKDINF